MLESIIMKGEKPIKARAYRTYKKNYPKQNKQFHIEG